MSVLKSTLLRRGYMLEINHYFLEHKLCDWVLLQVFWFVFAFPLPNFPQNVLHAVLDTQYFVFIADQWLQQEQRIDGLQKRKQSPSSWIGSVFVYLSVSGIRFVVLHEVDICGYTAHTLLGANFKYFHARSKFPEMFVLSVILRSSEHVEPCLKASSLLIDVSLFGSLETN